MAEKATQDEHLRRPWSSRLIVLGGGLLLAVAILGGYWGPHLAKQSECSDLGGSLESQTFSPSAAGLKGTPGKLYSCIAPDGSVLKDYGLSVL